MVVVQGEDQGGGGEDGGGYGGDRPVCEREFEEAVGCWGGRDVGSEGGAEGLPDTGAGGGGV